MREVISVHVGQAGVQIGNACCKFQNTPFPDYPVVTSLKMMHSFTFAVMAIVRVCFANIGASQGNFTPLSTV